MSAATPLLSVQNLSISFRTPKGLMKVVDNISFNIHAGECLAVVGESGCSKTVSALSIVGLLNRKQALVEGSIRFKGDEISTLTEEELRSIRGRGIGMIFQEPLSALNPVTTIGEQIAEVIVAHRGISWKHAHHEAIKYLERVEIAQPEQRARQFPHQLSGGMRQRAMIAMALAGEPQLIIADEPTTALDVTIQAQVLQLLRKATTDREVSLMLITHDLGIVAETSDRIAVMYAGEIVEEGRSTDVLRQPRNPYTLDLVNSIPSFERRGSSLATIAGSVPSPDNFPTGCRFHPRCRFAVSACAAAVPPLEIIEGGRSVRCIRHQDLASQALAASDRRLT